MADEKRVVIHVTDPPTQPPIHAHRWGWAQLRQGGTREVCRDCGQERRRGW